MRLIEKVIEMQIESKAINIFYKSDGGFRIKGLLATILLLLAGVLCPLSSQELDSLWEVVKISESPYKIQRMTSCPSNNIYTLESVVHRPSDSVSQVNFRVSMFNSDAELRWSLDSVNFGNLNHNRPDGSMGVHVGNTRGQLKYKNGILYVGGNMRNASPLTHFLMKIDAQTGVPLDTVFISEEDEKEFANQTVSLYDVVTNDSVVFRIVSQIYFPDTIQKMYRIDGDRVTELRNDDFPGIMGMPGRPFLINNELYTYSIWDSLITHYNIDGEIVDTVPIPYRTRLIEVEDGTSYHASPDFFRFDGQRIVQPSFEASDFDPDLDDPVLNHWERLSDGSFLAFGITTLFNNTVLYLYRFYEDGTTDYAWSYDPWYFAMEIAVGAREIDRGIVVAGFISDQKPNGGNYLALINDQGFFVDVEDPIVSEPKVNLKVYPNPFSDRLNIEVSSEHLGGVLNIYDPIGSVVHSERINSRSHSLYLSNFPSGIYFLEYVGANFKGVLHNQLIIKH
jgi:hypothetical protein